MGEMILVVVTAFSFLISADVTPPLAPPHKGEGKRLPCPLVEEGQGGSAPTILVPLEPPLQLPIRHAAVVFELLPARRVHIVVDHVAAERRPQHLGLVEQLDRLAQRLRDLADALAEIGVADEGRLELQLLVDAGEPGGDQRGEGEMRG